jgi:hypothetical protein
MAQEVLDQGMGGVAFFLESSQPKPSQGEERSLRGGKKDQPPEQEKNQVEPQWGVDFQAVFPFLLANRDFSSILASGMKQGEAFEAWQTH